MDKALSAAQAECCAAGTCPHAHVHQPAPAQPQLEQVLG
jgi:hypothetical protein